MSSEKALHITGLRTGIAAETADAPVGPEDQALPACPPSEGYWLGIVVKALFRGLVLTGCMVVELVDIERGRQDRSLFELPEGMSVEEM